MGAFPDCFPADFETSILPAQAEYAEHTVYRVAKFGVKHPHSYLSTFEENLLYPRPKIRKCDLRAPGTYSTSCRMNVDWVINFLELTLRNPPQAEIVMGITHPSCGPSLVDLDGQGKPTGHVHWWIYKDVKPQEYFSKYIKAV